VGNVATWPRAALCRPRTFAGSGTHETRIVEKQNRRCTSAGTAGPRLPSPDRLRGQSALAPDALTIGPQRAVSTLFISTICSGVLPMML
jgi:hypothetical protein